MHVGVPSEWLDASRQRFLALRCIGDADPLWERG